tara:strand:+ start:91 stop:276 length:186 start_codon:yes stop_codon:yes gene_type:complete
MLYHSPPPAVGAKINNYNVPYGINFLRESRDNFENREMSHKNTPFGERLRAAQCPQPLKDD